MMVSTQSTQSDAWTAALFDYQLRCTLRDADIAFGTYAKDMRAFDDAKAIFELKYGGEQRIRDTEEAQAEWEPVWEAQVVAEDRRSEDFLKPCDAAAVALVKTPAPNLEAMMLKVAVITDNELDNYVGMDVDPMELIWADAVSLQGK